MSEVKLTHPYQAPAGTFIAEKITDMFSVAISQAMEFEYKIGEASIQQYRIAVRNDTVSNALKVVVGAPLYITLSKATEFVIGPTEIAYFLIRVNDQVVQDLIHTNYSEFAEQLTFTAEPLNITGPVYVFKKLDALTA